MEKKVKGKIGKIISSTVLKARGKIGKIVSSKLKKGLKAGCKD